LGAEHRNLLLELADEWRKAAEELEEFDRPDGEENWFSNKQGNG
jgi:hypothetical protein